MQRILDEHATIQPAEQQTRFVEVRGKSGRLRGWYNPETQELRFQDRRDQQPEIIRLADLTQSFR